MLTHTEQRLLPYTPQQMFDLVLDIGKYPEFLPWCMAARITERQEHMLCADVMVGYKVFREKFTSKVIFETPNRIHVDYQSGPMNNLENHWVFNAHSEGCLINFHVGFDFKSKFFEGLINQFFDKAISKMITAFEERAATLYGCQAEQ